MLSSSSGISIDLFKRILANTHVEVAWATTAYSTICDLKNGKLYIYYFHNFAEEVVLDISREVKKGYRTLELGSLFPASVAVKDFIWVKKREIEERKAKKLAKLESAGEMEKLSGTFVNSSDPEDRMVIKFEKDKLRIINADQSSVELFPESVTKYFIPWVNGDFDMAFMKDESKNKLELVIEHKVLGIKMRYQRKE